MKWQCYTFLPTDRTGSSEARLKKANRRHRRKRNRDKDPDKDSNTAPHPTSSPGNRQLHPATTGSKARAAGATRLRPAAGQVAGAVRGAPRRLQQAQGIAGRLFHSPAQPWRGRAAARIGPWGGRDDGPPIRVRLAASSRHRRAAWIGHRGRRLRAEDQPAATTLSQNGVKGWRQRRPTCACVHPPTAEAARARATAGRGWSPARATHGAPPFKRQRQF